MKSTMMKCMLLASAFLACLALIQDNALAHCDGLDGPVVTAARKAIESRNVNLALIWVQQQDEAEIRNAFEKTLAVRSQSPKARELADTHFFETLVRIHRAGEGAPYTGLKPAGRDLGPAIPAGDKVLEMQSPDAILKLLTEALRENLQAKYHEVSARSKYNKDDVAAGRLYVKSYVEYIHLVERMYEAAKSTVEGHVHEAAAAENHEHP